jgi:hypothetical protein
MLGDKKEAPQLLQEFNLQCQRQTEESLAKSPARQRGDRSITAYSYKYWRYPESPMRKLGDCSDPALETALKLTFIGPASVSRGWT